MSVRLRYRYRDASNYTAEMETVIAGAFDEADVRRLTEAMATAARGAGIDPNTFSPIDYGLPPAQMVMWARGDQNSDDHIYNELVHIESTQLSVTWERVDAAELLRRAEHAAAVGYDVTRAMDEIGIPA